MPRGDRSTATREALLRSAAKVFTRRGPYGATVREIAEEAGVTVPAIYYHFEGTEQLYDSVVREGRARFRAMVEAAIATEAEPRARLAAFARACVGYGQEEPTRLRLLCMDLFGPQDRVADRGVAELRDWVQEQLVALFAELGARDGARDAEWPPFAARLFVAVMNGLLVEQAREPETAILEQDLGDRAVDVFLHGIAPRACAGSRNGAGS
jgi:AcrR family transcriptional regulator